MVDVFEYDVEVSLKCNDGELKVGRTKIVTLGTGDFSARGAMVVDGAIDSSLLGFGVNGYKGKITGKTAGITEGLDKYLIAFDLTDTTPDLLKKGYDKERATTKIAATGWTIM
ncbi:MAG: hypothetical protein ACUZ8O_03140 [Candidatus Anammoxibacter sp.]